MDFYFYISEAIRLQEKAITWHRNVSKVANFSGFYQQLTDNPDESDVGLKCKAGKA